MFAKHGVAPDAGHTLEREARVLRHLGRSGCAPDLSPELLGWLPDVPLLVTGLLRNAQSLSAVYETRARFRRDLGASLGVALARLHDCPPVPDLAPAERPWVLSIHRPVASQLSDFSPAVRQLVGVLQTDEGLALALDVLARDWRGDAVVHGDLKLDNIVLADGAIGRARGLYLTDFETAGAGDWRYDLGSAIAAYLQIWVQSIVNARDLTTGEGRARAGLRLERVAPTIQAMCGAYVQTRRVRPAARDLFVSTAFAGLRLLQFLYEMHRTGLRFHDQSALQLQLASNLLQRPEEAARGLLGLV